jgi:hypothetical protein
MDDYQKGYERGYADGHAKGFVSGSLDRQKVPEDFRFDDANAARWLRCALLDLEDENARLIAKLRGYVLAGSAKGPGVLKPDKLGLCTARGLSREAYKPRHRRPFVLGPDGAWKRAKGRLRVEDWAMRLPPKVCEACGHLFVTGRRDARTCSSRCRMALHRRRHQPAPPPSVSTPAQVV